MTLLQTNPAQQKKKSEVLAPMGINTKPNHSKPFQTKPNQTKPNQTKPNQPKPN
jgi:hypothetical protein